MAAPMPRRGREPNSRRKLRERGRSYHIHHPFNVMLNGGRATPEQVRGWVANRFYYQIAIPIKDAAVLSNCPDREVRRGWVQRILDHDGFELDGVRDEGGIEAWLRLAEAVGLARDGGARPAPRGAGDALRGRRLRELRAPRALAGGGVLVADRAVRARDPQAAARDLARALPLDRARGPGATSAIASARRGATSSRAWRSRWRTSRPGRCRSARSRCCSSSSTSCGP